MHSLTLFSCLFIIMLRLFCHIHLNLIYHRCFLISVNRAFCWLDMYNCNFIWSSIYVNISFHCVKARGRFQVDFTGLSRFTQCARSANLYYVSLHRWSYMEMIIKISSWTRYYCKEYNYWWIISCKNHTYMERLTIHRGLVFILVFRPECFVVCHASIVT